MSYINAFVRVSEDCPVTESEIPIAKGDKKPAHLIQYELLIDSPYTYDHEGLIYEVFIRHKAIPVTSKPDSKRIKEELFSKGHPCMRASALVKRYGFGAHYNQDGKIAIYPMESNEYEAFASDRDVKQLPGMKTKR